VVDTPRPYRTAEQHLQKAHRRVARRKQGSTRRKKAVHLLKRTHQRVQRQRRDFHHKTALALVRRYDVIYLEDLQIRNLSAGRNCSRTTTAAISRTGQAQRLA
jgi:putative transposase